VRYIVLANAGGGGPVNLAKTNILAALEHGTHVVTGHSSLFARYLRWLASTAVWTPCSISEHAVRFGDDDAQPIVAPHPLRGSPALEPLKSNVRAYIYTGACFRACRAKLNSMTCGEKTPPTLTRASRWGRPDKVPVRIRPMPPAHLRRLVQ
jgi:hypothetical protein